MLSQFGLEDRSIKIAIPCVAWILQLLTASKFIIFNLTFGRGDTRVRESFIVAINTFDRISKFILTCNAIYGVFN